MVAYDIPIKTVIIDINNKTRSLSYSVQCLKTFHCWFGLVLPMSVKCGLSLRSAQWLLLDDMCSQLVWVVQLWVVQLWVEQQFLRLLLAMFPGR